MFADYLINVVMCLICWRDDPSIWFPVSYTSFFFSYASFCAVPAAFSLAIELLKTQIVFLQPVRILDLADPTPWRHSHVLLSSACSENWQVALSLGQTKA